MIDRRDFDEWWAREQARNGGPIGADYRHWAEAGFMAAARLMAQAAREQKARARDAQRPAAVLLRDMFKAADK